MTARFHVAVWVVCALIVGLCLGVAAVRLGSDCHTVSHDGGITVTEICTRQVAP